MNVNIELMGVEALSKELRRKSQIRFDGVCAKSLTDMYNKATEGGYTPVDTGELRESALSTLPSGEGDSGEMGYLKEYAPHVEYGHRTLDGGFVKGQRFLQKNVEDQNPIFREDLLTQLRR